MSESSPYPRGAASRRAAAATLGVLALAAASCWSLSDPLPTPLCESGQKLCADLCVTYDDPAYGCGAESCDPCGDAHGTATCDQGQCALSGCEQDYDDCNDDPADGCETYLVDNDQHCGMCGYDCLGTACSAGMCGMIQIGAGQRAVWNVVANQTHVYWTTDEAVGEPVGGVWYTPIDATGPELAQLYAPVAGGPRPRDLAIDDTHVYWSSGSWDPSDVHEVRRAVLGQTPPAVSEVLNDGIGGPRDAAGIAIDGARVYWSDGGDPNADPVEPPAIWSVDKAGSETPVQVAVMETRKPNLVVLDETTIYWTSTDTGNVYSAAKTATQTIPTQVCYTDSGGPGWGIAVDAEQLFWREGTNLRAAPKDGQDCPAVTTMLADRDTSRFMTRDGRCLYWMYATTSNPWEDGWIVVSRTDGADIAPGTDEPALFVVSTTPGGGHGISVDRDWIYWTKYHNGETNLDGAVYKVARPPLDCD